MMHVALLFSLTLITVFGVVGVVLMVRALRESARETSFLEPVSSSRTEQEAMSLKVPGFRAPWRRLVRRTHGEVALLGPRRRVLVELLGALCGFPGLGWVLSGRVALGMTLLVGCPAVVWALLPMSLSVVGHFGLGLTLGYLLPLLALASAGALALVERRESALVRAPSAGPGAAHGT